MEKRGTERESGAPAMITLELVRGLIGVPRTQREVVRGLGLRRIGSRVTRPDTRITRGMVRRVAHLVRVGSPQESPVEKPAVAGSAPGDSPSKDSDEGGFQ